VLDGIEVEDSMLGPQFSDPNGVCGSARIDVCPLRGSLTVIFDGDRWSWKEWLIEMSANKERKASPRHLNFRHQNRSLSGGFPEAYRSHPCQPL